MSWLDSLRALPGYLKVILFFAFNSLVLYTLTYLFKDDTAGVESANQTRTLWIISALIISFTYYVFFPRKRKSE